MATIDTKAFFALVHATKETLSIEKDPVAGDIRGHQTALNEFFQNPLVQETYAKLGIAAPKDIPLVPDDDLGPKTTEAYEQFFLGAKVALIHLDTPEARAENNFDIYGTIDPLLSQLEQSSSYGGLEYLIQASDTDVGERPTISSDTLETAIRSPLTKDSIETIQLELTELGLNPGAPDKVLGPKTSGALAEYFKANLGVYQTMDPTLKEAFASFITPEDYQHLEKQSLAAAELVAADTTDPSITHNATARAGAESQTASFKGAAENSAIITLPDSVQIPDNSISLYIKEGFESVSGPLIKELTDRGVSVFATYEQYEGSTHLYEQGKLQATPVTNADALGNIAKLPQIKLENIPEDYRGKNPESALNVLRPRNQSDVRSIAHNINLNLSTVAIKTVIDDNNPRNNTSYLDVNPKTYRPGTPEHKADWERGRDDGGGVIKLQLGSDVIQNPTNFPHIVAESVAQEFGLVPKKSPGQLVDAFKIRGNTVLEPERSARPEPTPAPNNDFSLER